MQLLEETVGGYEVFSELQLLISSSQQRLLEKCPDVWMPTHAGHIHDPLPPPVSDISSLLLLLSWQDSC